MLRQIGPVELIVILAIVLLVFGVGRVSRVGRELGSAIRGFQQGLKGNEADESQEDSSNP
jgi:sec-independent protein translocase protein TatA